LQSNRTKIFAGDFPSIDKMRAFLYDADFKKLGKVNTALIKRVIPLCYLV